MRHDVDVIEILAGVNPVPPGTVLEDPPSLEEVLRSPLERNDAMSSTMTEPARDTQRKSKWPRYLAAAAALAAVSAVIGALIPLTGPVASDIDWGDTPSDLRVVITGVVEAVEVGTPEAFIDAFTSDGTFATHLDFEPRTSCCDTYPVSDPGLVETWMAVNEAWNLEADVQACRREGERWVECDVRARWHNLQTEIAETWRFAFEGTEVRTFATLIADMEPEDRVLPLDYAGFQEWEAWLEENDPAEFARMKEYDGPFPGVFFESVLLRWHPALAEEVRASIDDYLTTR